MLRVAQVVDLVWHRSENALSGAPLRKGASVSPRVQLRLLDMVFTAIVIVVVVLRRYVPAILNAGSQLGILGGRRRVVIHLTIDTPGHVLANNAILSLSPDR